MTWIKRGTGLDTEVINYIVQNPATYRLGSEGHELWAATYIGIYRTLNGGRQWIKIELPDPSNDEIMDAPAATIDNLEFIWIGYDPTDNQILYSVAAHKDKARVWAYKTTNSGLTWISRGIIVP